MFKSIDYYWLKTLDLVRFFITDNLIECNVQKFTKHSK
jgi:hypothetical protein